MKTIGVVGLGFVGTAVQKGFENMCNVLTYDIAKECTERNIQSLVAKAQIIFICVPTPMNADGTCNTDIVRNVLGQITTIHTEHKPICVLKSTIPPGTSNGLAEEFPNLTVCFNPEFLTEKNYINDFINQSNIVLGYTSCETSIRPVQDLYRERFPDVALYTTTAPEAEMIKYVANTMLATKVAFLNEIWQICRKSGIHYGAVIENLKNDPRLGNTHWQVPGPDGHFGFGGTCFPKDINALMKFSEQNGQPTPLLDAIWEKNLEVRPERDWEQDKGRAVT